MYIKSDRELYRRRRIPWVRLLLILVVGAAGGYVGYRTLRGYVEPLVAVNTPTPMPTATPSAGFYAAEADAAYWDGATGAAIRAYQQSLDMEPHQTPLYLELARLLTYYGQPERGLEMARQALVRQPENARAWALLGLTYDWLGLPGQAVAFCRRAVELDPTLPEAHAYLAEAYIDNGQWSAANQSIDTAMALDETNVDVLRNRGYVLENQGNYYGAIDAYREALDIHEELIHLYLAIGRNATALQNLVLARETYQDAVDIDPDHALALDNLGWIQLLLGEYDQARLNLERAVEIDPTLASAHAHLGTLYFQQLNYEDAIEFLGPAIKFAEARSRRRTVLFILTAEELNAGTEPLGTEVAYAEFVHPSDLTSPMRADIQGSEPGSTLSGRIRFDVMEGRYQAVISGVPPAPSGTAYVGWFLPLLSPEKTAVRTEPLFPSPDGQIEVVGTTGPVSGPPIEQYYILALAHYQLDQCDRARPYIEVALRIDPDDAQALTALDLCR
jgi:tetratricopeptide (TPR) repeat protein